MNFLNDKKNLPIVIAVVVVVLIGAIGSGLYFAGVFGQGSGTVVATGPSVAPAGSIPDPSSPTGYRMPGMPAGPGAPNGPAMGARPGVASGPGVPAHNPYAPQTPAENAAHRVAMGGPSAGETPRPGMARPGAPMPGMARPGMPRPGMPVPGMARPGMQMSPNGMPANHNGKLIGHVPGKTPGAGKMLVAAGMPANKVVFTGDPTVGPDPFYTKAPPRPKNSLLPTNLFGKPIVPSLPPIEIDTPPTVPVMPTGNNPTEPAVQLVTNDSFRRVSGILHSSDGVYAVLETNGVSQTVQPGDDVGGAKVTGIDDNGVTLKTDDNKVLHVPLSDTASVVTK